MRLLKNVSLRSWLIAMFVAFMAAGGARAASNDLRQAYQAWSVGQDRAEDYRTCRRGALQASTAESRQEWLAFCESAK